MKKLSRASMITLAVGLTLVLVSAVLVAVRTTTWTGKTQLTDTLTSIGYLVSALSGVLLTGCAVVGVVKGGDVKKLLISATIIVAVGITMVIAAGVLGSVSGKITGFDVGTTTTGFAGTLNTIGYLASVLAGVLLVASGVVSAVKDEKK